MRGSQSNLLRITTLACPNQSRQNFGRRAHIKGDNVQKFCSAISPTWGQNGELRRVAHSRFFCSQNNMTFCQLPDTSIHVPSKYESMEFLQIFRLVVIPPPKKTSKSKGVKQVLWPAYSPGDALQKDRSLHIVVQGPGSFPHRVSFSYDVRFRCYGMSNFPSFRIFAYFSHV